MDIAAFPGSALLTREEVVNSPSRVDGVAYEVELVMRNAAVTQLMQVGQKKEIKKQIIATACVLFHRFFSRRSLKKFDRLEVALACLVLAGKAVDFVQPVLFRAVIPERLARQGHPRETGEDTELWRSTREQLCLVERHVLSALEYDVCVELPFEHVDALCATAGISPPAHPLRELAIKMLNDVLKTPLVLQYPPRTLAQSALLFARAQLDKVAAMGRGPKIPLPPYWEVALGADVVSPETAQAVLTQFSEAMTVARREIERQAQAMQGAAGAVPGGPAGISSGGGGDGGPGAGGAGAGAGAGGAGAPP